jgi:hypothetical protein
LKEPEKAQKVQAKSQKRQGGRAGKQNPGAAAFIIS